MEQHSTGVFDKKTRVSYWLSVLVFWIHCSSFENYSQLPHWVVVFWRVVQDVVTPGAVPLFFVLSGVMFFRNYRPESFRQKLARRMRSQVVPYLCWNVLNMLFTIVTSAFLARYFVGRKTFGWTAGEILGGIFLFGYNTPFWFLFMLILFTLLTPVFDRLTRNPWVGLGAAIALAVLTNWEMPWVWIRTGITCAVYYLCGGLMGRYLWDWFSTPAGKRQQWLCGAALVGINVVRFFGMTYGIGMMSALKAFALVGEGLCLWFFADCFTRRPPEFMEHSFFVFAMHMNVSAVVTKLIFLLTPDVGWLAPVNFLLTTAITLLIIEIVCQVLKKYTPPVYRVLSGGR